MCCGRESKRLISIVDKCVHLSTKQGAHSQSQQVWTQRRTPQLRASHKTNKLQEREVLCCGRETKDKSTRRDKCVHLSTKRRFPKKNLKFRRDSQPLMTPAYIHLSIKRGVQRKISSLDTEETSAA